MKNLFIFALGIGTGSLITWKLVEKKYKDLADEEIASVVETFKNRKPTKKTKKEIKEKVDNLLDSTRTRIKTSLTEAEEIVETSGYVSNDIEDDDCTVNVDNGEEIIVPYIILPDQFGEFEEYGTKTLTLYADNILTDEIDKPITDDLEIMLGPDPFSHFGEYEDDAIYIRDEMNEIDYEILKSEKEFSEIPRGSAN